MDNFDNDWLLPSLIQSEEIGFLPNEKTRINTST